MNEILYVGAYWLARAEDANACAQRAELFFRLLADCDPCLSQWFETGRTLEEALKYGIKTKEDFLEAFRRQEDPASELGSSLWLWNGEDNENGSKANFTCGCASIWVSNVCVFNVPRTGVAAERMIQAPILARILRAMALAWEPECGVALSHEHLDKVSESAEAGTFLGWVSYFSHRRGPVPPLPPPVQVEPVEDKGTLIILTPERFTASNPAHLELALRTTETLSQAGLLGPLRPWDS
jgi:hypothetical protein